MLSQRSTSRAILSLAAVMLIQACSDNELTTAPPAVNKAADADSLNYGPSTEPLAERLVTSIATLDLKANGPFAINKPINIRAIVLGKYNVSQARVSISVRGGGRFTSGEKSTVVTRPTSLADGQEFTFEDEVVFSQPGYYEVLAAVGSIGEKLPTSKGDSALIPSVQQSAWVYVGESDGKFDRLYDVTRLTGDGRAMQFGVYGPFESTGVAAPPAAVSVSTIGTRASLMSDPVMSGVFMYTSSDIATFGQLQPVPNALIDGYCKVGSFPTAHISVATNSVGQFSVTCPAGSTTYDGDAKLEQGSARIAYLMSGAYYNFPFNVDANATDTIATIPEMGVVFKNHQKYNLGAPSLFGKSIGQIQYVVNPGSGAPSNYDVGNYRIYMNSGSYWDAWGRFVTSHEYGHAFHYLAIDPWRTYQCVSPQHGFFTQETSSCAYVEGFADFFSFWMTRNEAPADQYFTNATVEYNYNPGTVQGLVVEFYFAATLWDMVDDASTPDTYSGDDDGLAMTPAQIAEIMLRCRLVNPNEYLISHTDQFVYCAEYGVNNARYAAPASFQSLWGLYGTMTWDGGAPTLPYWPTFRDIWKRNFYAI